MPKLRLLAAAIVLPIAVSSFAQATKPGTPAQGQAAPPANQAQKSDFKPYDQVVTKEAVTQEGVFKVHRIDDRILWEIPASMLGRDFLWQNEISEVNHQSGAYSGQTATTNVVKFTRRNKKLYMRAATFDARNQSDNLEVGLRQVTLDPILMQFDIQTEGANASVVIDVTSLFLSDPEPFSVRGQFGSPGVDTSKSWVDRVKAFPINIETRCNMNFLPGRGGNQVGQGPSGGGPITAVIHSSLLLLPENPMMGRYKDSRIGFFSTGFTTFDAIKPVKQREYINRFRLEKKDPNAPMSEPVKPITYYLAREVPARWREDLRRGVLGWNEAFEKIGYKNAIVCLDAPSEEQDPFWDAEDARYNVIRWAPSPTANAMGPSVQDPRSGENLNAHIIFWSNIVDLVQKWYVIQSGAIDPDCKKNPLPDALMDKLITYVCEHEIGHTLGLEHNFRASASRTIAQLRSHSFMATHGVSSSIMSYSRNNYVAQPGDGITYSNNGRLGEYDFFAIQYGYGSIPGANSPDDEVSALDRLLSRQVNDPTVRFGNYKYNVDPTTMSENIGEDAVEATRLGLKNLDRIGPMLLPLASKFGEDYSDLSDWYSEFSSHRLMWLMHVTRQVGGVVEYDVHAGRGGDVFKPVAKDRQAKAVKFLVDEGLVPTAGMVPPAIIARISPTGYLNNITVTQNLIFSQLFAEARLQRMFDWEAMKGAKNTYTVAEMTSTVFGSVFKDLNGSNPVISLPRRQLQRSFLRSMEARLSGTGKSSTDFALLGTDALRTVARRIDKVLPTTKDKMTGAHLADTRKWINRIISGTSAPTPPAATNILDLFGFKEMPQFGKDEVCFGREAMLQELLRSLEK